MHTYVRIHKNTASLKESSQVKEERRGRASVLRHTLSRQLQHVRITRNGRPRESTYILLCFGMLHRHVIWSVLHVLQANVVQMCICVCTSVPEPTVWCNIEACLVLQVCLHRLPYLYECIDICLTFRKIIEKRKVLGKRHVVAQVTMIAASLSHEKEEWLEICIPYMWVYFLGGGVPIWFAGWCASCAPRKCVAGYIYDVQGWTCWYPNKFVVITAWQCAMIQAYL
jgi:hypothetical protein